MPSEGYLWNLDNCGSFFAPASIKKKKMAKISIWLNFIKASEEGIGSVSQHRDSPRVENELDRGGGTLTQVPKKPNQLINSNNTLIV